MKKSIRVTLGMTVLIALAVGLLFGASRYGWTPLFDGGSKPSFEAALPAYVMGSDGPKFGPECGEYGLDVGGGAYGFNADLEYHTNHSTAIVEGTAELAGPARFGNPYDTAKTVRLRGMDAVSRINTPFTIKVSKTHKGPERTEWAVSESGGLVGCISYRESADSAQVFDGATGLFFISASPLFQGDSVTMAIIEDGPEWFEFTESNFGPVDQAVSLVKTFE